MAAVALVGATLTGCGAAYPTCDLDPYGTTGACVAGASGYGYDSSSYSSTYSSYDSGASYSSGTSYDSTSYGSSYGSSYDSTSYGSSYGTGYGSTTGTTIDPNTGYAVTTGATTGTQTVVNNVTVVNATTLSAYVKDTKKTGLLGLGGLIAHVEVTNPTSRALSGLLKVTFTHDGSPSGAAQTQRITLKPLETQVLTFTAKTLGLNDAEATVNTDNVAQSESSVGGSAVVDR